MTDERTPFERQLAGRLEQMAGPEPHVDVAASVRAATAPSPRWRFSNMFSAARLFVAGAVVATFGGYLLVDSLTRTQEPVPAAPGIGVSCPEAAALFEAREAGSTAGPAIVSRVHMEPIGEDGADEGATTIDEADGYGRVGFAIDGIPVKADDDRLSGFFRGEVVAHFFTEDDGYLTGTVSIGNEAGSWSGELRGFAGEDGAMLHYELVGDGSYAGCAVSLQGGFDGPYSGIVFPASALAEH